MLSGRRPTLQVRRDSRDNSSLVASTIETFFPLITTNTDKGDESDDAFMGFNFYGLRSLEFYFMRPD